MHPGYTSDDFAQPGFCQMCGAHTPKSVLVATGGRCGHCARTGTPPGPIGGAPQPGYNPGFPGGYMGAQPGAYVQPRTVWSASGCAAVALLFGIIALLVGGMMYFLKIPASRLSQGLHKDIPQAFAPKGSNGASGEDAEAGLTDSLDIPDADKLKDEAVAQIEGSFGKGLASPESVELRTVTDHSDPSFQGANVVAEGNFNATVGDNRVSVRWRMGFVSESPGNYRLVFREASVPTLHGTEQWDWDQHQFVRLDTDQP